MKPSEIIKKIAGPKGGTNYFIYRDRMLDATIEYLDEEYERKSMTGYNEGPVDNDGKPIGSALTPLGGREQDLDELKEAHYSAIAMTETDYVSAYTILQIAIRTILRRHGRIK